MRILYDHQVFSLQDAGGASRYHFELVRNLQQLDGVAIEVLMGLNGSVMPFATLQRPRTRVFGHRTALKPGRARYATNEVLSAIIAPLRGRVDIYHPTLYRAIPWVRRRRVVVTHHDCIHERFPHLFKNAPAIIESKRKLFAQADAIVCVSNSSRSDLHRFYDLSEKKTHVVYHGFSPLLWRRVTGQARLNPTCSTWARAPATRISGSCSRPSSAAAWLEATACWRSAAGSSLPRNRNGSRSSVSLARSASIPRAEDAILARAYRGAALFIYPSLYEGFGFPPLEAMSLGCPVLVNRTSSLPEICGDAAFYFEACDADELSQSLTTTLADEQGLALKRRLGKQQVALYDWNRSALSTLDVYRSVLRFTSAALISN